MFLDKETLLKIWLKGEVTRDDCNEDFKRNTALQHCCDIVSNGHNIVPALQRCVALKIVVVNRLVCYHLNLGLNLTIFPGTGPRLATTRKAGYAPGYYH